MRRTLVVLVAALASCQHVAPQAAPAAATAAANQAPPTDGRADVVPIPADLAWFGPDTVETDLLRAGTDDAERQRVFVQAKLPDGSLGLFMIDTGAAISVMNEKTAERLGLDLERDYSEVEGLGGRSTYHRAVLPALGIGAATVPQVEFAVGVRGIPDYADGGLTPLDGILGNNVWSRFVMEVDYPSDTLALHRPGTFKMPRKSGPLQYVGNEVYTTLSMTTKTDPPYTGSLPIIQVDTGASGLMISGPDKAGFDDMTDAKGDPLFTEGLEPVLGVGAADTMPANVFFKKTRRIPLKSVDIGGRDEPLDLSAQWIDWAPDATRLGPTGLTGLVGYELMSGWDTIFDYQGERFALTKSHRKARKLDFHRVLLDQDVAKYGDDPSRLLYRARLETALEDYKSADAHLSAYLASNPTDAKDAGQARVILAAIRRYEGDLPGAWKAIESLSPHDLVDQDQIIAAVNGLLLDGHQDDALALADASIKAYVPPAVAGAPSSVATALATIDKDAWDPMKASEAHVARADVLFTMGRYAEANDELLQAGELIDNPDAQLLRRARIALASGDRYGAMADIRRLLQLYPSNGQYLWFYATLLQSDSDKQTFEVDMAQAVSRLHQEDRPLDYMVIAHHLLGEQDQALSLMKTGLARDCDRPELEAKDKDNCYAWYYAMAGTEPDQALSMIDEAVAADKNRSDYLDTKAMVHLSRGEYDEAHEAALEAARLSPDEVYMLWQAERIGQIASQHKQPPTAKQDGR